MDEVEKLIEQLKDPDAEKRKEAAERFGELKDTKVVPALVIALRYDRDRDVRVSAAVSLGEIGDVRALDALIEKLDHPDDFTVRSIVDIAKANPTNPVIEKAIPRLIKNLKNGGELARYKSAKALGEIGDSRAVPALIEAMNDYMGTVRNYVAIALGEIKDARAFPVLIERFKDKADTPSVQEDCVRALIKIGNPAVPALIEALRDEHEYLEWFGPQTVLFAILENCKNTDQFEEFEMKLKEGYANLHAKYHDKNEIRDIEIQIAKLKMEIIEKKNQLTQDQGILLDDKPKPPKKGMYQQLRRVRNG